jgi:hypothetical protein
MAHAWMHGEQVCCRSQQQWYLKVLLLLLLLVAGNEHNIKHRRCYPTQTPLAWPTQAGVPSSAERCGAATLTSCPALCSAKQPGW